VLEARRDFEKALGRVKSQGNRRRPLYDSDPVDLDDIGSEFRKRMENAAILDQESVEEGKPALAKHKMLPEVVEMLNKKHMHEVLLDCGILSAVKLWLEPLPNRSLPAIHLRKTLLELLRNLAIETDHLRDSQVGRIVMFFARRPHESPDIQRLAKDLVARWSRPLIGDHNVADTPREAPSMQSEAFREVVGRSEGGLSSQHRKLAMRMQKKARSKKV
jgi:transcription factor SPN1